MDKVEFNGKVYDATHGSPFDRGSADSYYRRGRQPHYWPEGTGHGEMVPREAMTEEQLSDYYAGFEWNEEHGDRKFWG